jgi:hypothetical protein
VDVAGDLRGDLLVFEPFFLVELEGDFGDDSLIFEVFVPVELGGFLADAIFILLGKCIASSVERTETSNRDCHDNNTTDTTPTAKEIPKSKVRIFVTWLFPRILLSILDIRRNNATATGHIFGDFYVSFFSTGTASSSAK